MGILEHMFLRVAHRLNALAIVLALFPIAAFSEEHAGFILSFRVVGTPEFMGPPRITDPGFIPPIAETVVAPKRADCLAGKGAGEYEALIAADGSVASIRSHYEPITGDNCEKEFLFPYIMKWRFRPATYNGKPTSVYMRFGLK